MVGFDMSKKAAENVYAMAKIAPKDIQVIELHDCFSANELLTYEALGFLEYLFVFVCRLNLIFGSDIL